MTFSEETKHELVRLKPERNCCMLSEISALTQSCASLRFLGRGKLHLVYQTENLALAKRIFLLLKLRMNITVSIEYAYVNRFGGRRICTLTLQDQDTKQLMTSLHMIRLSESGLPVLRGIPRNAYTKRCCRGAYLRGAFLGSGMMLNPEKGYMMKFIATDSEKIRWIRDVLEKSGIPFVTRRLKEKDELLVTSGDGVSTLLTMMGATSAMMKMEDIRIRHESKNKANRAANCDSGNLKKQLLSAQSQLDLLEAISGRVDVPKDILETAQIRIQYPDASLEELRTLFPKPLSKSGVYHRIQKAMQWIQQNPEPSQA